MDSHRAYLSEIFSSIQGEGPWIGLRQVFLRFSGCNLRCIWCDTPESLVLEKKKLTPLSVKEVLQRVVDFNQITEHHSISLTGGEPLLQAQFLKSLLLALKSVQKTLGLKTFLETGGHLPEKLEKLVDLLDFVSFDLKLPSSTQEKALWKEHQEFVQILSQAKTNAAAKIVVTSGTELSELLFAFELLRDKPNLELVLQPVSQTPDFRDPGLLGQERLDLYHKEAIKVLGAKKVRIIPQTHKILGVI